MNAARGWIGLAILLLCGMLLAVTAQRAGAQMEPFVGAPMHPLLAWDVAPDGAVFVLDSANRIYRLDPETLAPLDRSPRLALHFSAEPASLVATEEHLYVSGGALRQTHVVERYDFRRVAELDRSGLLAVDPDNRLFVLATAPTERIPSIEGPGVWAYDMADLRASPAVLIPPAVPGVESLPQGLTVDPVSRRLYVRMRNAGSPPHRGHYFDIYDLDTLEQVDGIDSFGPGDTTDPAIAASDLLLFGYSAAGGPLNSSVFALNGSSEVVARLHPLTGRPAVSPDGDWIYLLSDRSLWVLDGSRLSPDDVANADAIPLISVLPFTVAPPTDLRLSPDGSRLYLFGNGWLTVLPADSLHDQNLAAVAPFPAAWISRGGTDDSVRYYPSPQIEQDGTAFVLAGGYGDLYRSTDGGHTWRFDPAFVYPEFRGLRSLSLSPRFAEDETAVAATTEGWYRTVDGGETWQPWRDEPNHPPLYAFVSARDGNREVYVGNGEDVLRITDDPAADENPAWSPAWTQLVFQSDRNGAWDLYGVRVQSDGDSLTLAPGDLHQLTNSPGDDMLPAWSPDGRQIAFVSTRDGNPEIYVMRADGSEQRRITFHDGGDWRPAWLPDSERLVFVSDRAGNNDVYVVRVPPDSLLANDPATTREPAVTPVMQHPADDRDPAINSAGEMLFLSDRDGAMQLYLVDLNARGIYADDTEILATRFSADLETPVAHPSWWTDERAMIVLNEDIYTVGLGDTAEEFDLLVGGAGFDGHPAGGPVLWQPDPDSSRLPLLP